MSEVREKKRVLIVGDSDSFSYKTINALRNMYDVTVLENTTAFTELVDLILLDNDTTLGKSVLQKADSLPHTPIITISESDSSVSAEQTESVGIRHRLNKMWTSPSALLRVIAGVLG